MSNRLLKILIVDDEPEFCDFLASSLEKELDAKISVTDNGRDAMIQYGLHRPQVIVSDIRMPRGDGLEFLERIRNLGGQTPPAVVLTTGYADCRLEDVFADGADALFAKPFAVSDLVESIGHLTKPFSERWNFKYELKEEAKPLLFSNKNWITESSIGRGGFFVPAVENHFSVNTLVRFSVQTERGQHLNGLGRVAWSRKLASNNLAAGYGIEFIELDGVTVKVLTNLFSKKLPIPFIPKSA